MARLPLRLVGRLLGFLVASLFVGAIASAVAAAIARRRLVSIGGPEDDDVDLVTIFGALDFRSVARSFRHGSILSWFAGTQLDLRGAALDAGGGDLEVRTIFAGTNVVVPEGWRVTVKGPAVFGANSGPSAAEVGPDAPTLRVRAVSVFGATAVAAQPWDLAASENTIVIAGQVGEPAAEEPAAEEPAATEAPAAEPDASAAADPSAAAEPVDRPAPKRRRRKAAVDTGPAAEPTDGLPGQATEPG
jgi:hypothetical protein